MLYHESYRSWKRDGIVCLLKRFDSTAVGCTSQYQSSYRAKKTWLGGLKGVVCNDARIRSIFACYLLLQTTFVFLQKLELHLFFLQKLQGHLTNIGCDPHEQASDLGQLLVFTMFLIMWRHPSVKKGTLNFSKEMLVLNIEILIFDIKEIV